MTFEGDALVLGAGTRLGVAKRGLLLHKQGSEAFDEARVSALLAATYGRAIAPRELAYIRGALEKQSEGQTPLALVCLALAGLPKLQPPAEAAWRLSAADDLMKRGMAPSELLAAIGLGSTPSETIERAYNPDQPRVPAGNGRPSGQWMSGDSADDGAADDVAAPPNAPNVAASEGSRGVQIADDSGDWPQYLDPISSAEATESRKRPYNGQGPNDQHRAGVAAAIARFQANGFEILSPRDTPAVIAGFATPRVYDFVARDPETGLVYGVEVKTTMFDTIFFNSSQVDKDVAVYEVGAAVPGIVAPITRVAYVTICYGCSALDLRSYRLRKKLDEAGITIHTDFLPPRNGSP
jgi:hypothetical protein